MFSPFADSFNKVRLDPADRALVRNDVRSKAPALKLHGRPLSLGSRLYYLKDLCWVTVSTSNRGVPWVYLDHVVRCPQAFAWDEPDLAQVSPPLFFLENLPVRVGSVLYDTIREVAVQVVDDSVAQYVKVRLPKTGNIVEAERNHLTFTFPSKKPVRPSAIQTKTRWYNIYERDAARTSYQTYATEEEAKKHALPDCQGQGYFKYQFTGPLPE